MLCTMCSLVLQGLYFVCVCVGGLSQLEAMWSFYSGNSLSAVNGLHYIIHLWWVCNNHVVRALV